MPTVVGVRLRFSKTLWFDPAGTTPAEGDTVIVETERGTEIGKVVQPPHEVGEGDLAAPLKPVVRVADEEDTARIEELAAKEQEAMTVFRELVLEHKLDMKPVDVEYLLNGEKVVFYFSSDERVDFRELVRDLASRIRARIDMRQVGVRDEARAVGGVGHCGQMLCCVRFGGDFQPVSIRMAKDQDLPLNPLKISGLCGRLMCCLRYEVDAYKDFKSRAPKRGAIVDTPRGLAKVTDMSTPREAITMRFEDGKTATVPLASMSCKKGSGCPCSVAGEALEEAMPQSVSELEPVRAPRPSAPVPAAERSASKESESGEKQSSGRRRRRRKSGQGAQPQQAETPASSPQAETVVKRRRRGGGSGGSAADAGAQQQGSQAQGDAQPAADKAAKPRRRRRRRSGGGGNKDSQGSASE